MQRMKIIRWAVTLIGIALLCLLGFIWGAMSIKEYPTCAVYTFNLIAQHLVDFNSEVARSLAEQGMKIDGESKDGTGWRMNSAYVTMYAHEEREGTAFVCASEQNSNDWQVVAGSLEHALSHHSSRTSAHLQLNPSLFECGDYVCAAVDVEVPIDFAAFNGGALKLPPRK